jgi:hypothetical protein
MGDFQAGHLIPVSWQRQGGALAALNVKEHSLDLSVLLHDVTGVKALGVRARIAGPLDAQGRVVCDMDLDEAPFTDAVGITPGVRGIAVFGVSATRGGIQVPLICEKLHQACGTDKELMWDADWKMNSLAGDVVYPAL